MFQFKQFTIEQDQCAMKVCTDSCIMGAYLDLNNAQKVLDIGTGTGLLTLMLAQRHEVKFTALEIDKQAFTQAKNNFTNSKWRDHITLIHQDINQYASLVNSPQFDYIVCNPPFYENSLKSPNQQKNIVHHEGSLTQSQLLTCIKILLKTTGRFSVLLPIHEATIFEKKASDSDLYLYDSLTIAHHSKKIPFRRIDSYQFTPTTPSNKNLIIKDLSNNYTPEFRHLLQDYYLIF